MSKTSWLYEYHVWWKLAISEHLCSSRFFGEVGVAYIVSFLCCVVLCCVFCLRPVSCMPYIARVLIALSVSSNVYLIDIWTYKIYEHMVLETNTSLKEPVIVAKSEPLQVRTFKFICLDLNFVAWLIMSPQKQWRGLLFLVRFITRRVVFIYKIFIAVIKFSERF